MSAGHTPGPWAATPMVRHANNAFYISGNLKANNGEVDIGTVGPSLSPSVAANARLIAAAPELLEALEAALLVHGDDYSWGPQARSAIAKATGAA